MRRFAFEEKVVHNLLRWKAVRSKHQTMASKGYANWKVSGVFELCKVKGLVAKDKAPSCEMDD